MSEERKTYDITFSKGLDLLSGPFEASPDRAIDEMNYVYRDGKVQKRHGYSEILDLLPTHYTKVGFNGTVDSELKVNTVNFNGLWQFKAEDGEKHVIAHIGKLLYEITGIGTEEAEANPILQGTEYVVVGGYKYVRAYEFSDYRSTAFVGANMLYFLGGNQYMVLRFKKNESASLTPVANSDIAYVPTTTISISYEYALAGSRSSLDDVNLLSDFRKNTLLTGVGKDSTINKVGKYYRYVLDSPLIARNVKKDMGNFSIVLTERSE
ncbi:MAG: hypothetical protein LKG11_00710 [Bacilli bacterium]|jgi:hypothetical protein|nr:hypothetical protein [Bacilli bacterium]